MPPVPRSETPGLGPALSRALKAVRRRRGLRPAEVAEALGIKLRSYENFEAGRGRPNLDRIWRFAQALDADPYAILWAMFLDRPEIAVRTVDNKLGLVVAMAVGDFSEAVGADLARLDARTFILELGQAFGRLAEAARLNDAALSDWMMRQRPTPEAAPTAASPERTAEAQPTLSGDD